ncbi:hypothetical protein M2432_005281 [Mycobacterium sp. OTB74]|jgi:hypothetical protein|nr:hypothetical protein [Mycobacterium sp. OTB74]
MTGTMLMRNNKRLGNGTLRGEPVVRINARAAALKCIMTSSSIFHL